MHVPHFIDLIPFFISFLAQFKVEATSGEKIFLHMLIVISPSCIPFPATTLKWDTYRETKNVIAKSYILLMHELPKAAISFS